MKKLILLFLIAASTCLAGDPVFTVLEVTKSTDGNGNVTVLVVVQCDKDGFQGIARYYLSPNEILLFKGDEKAAVKSGVENASKKAQALSEAFAAQAPTQTAYDTTKIAVDKSGTATVDSVDVKPIPVEVKPE